MRRVRINTEIKSIARKQIYIDISIFAKVASDAGCTVNMNKTQRMIALYSTHNVAFIRQKARSHELMPKYRT